MPDDEAAELAAAADACGGHFPRAAARLRAAAAELSASDPFLVRRLVLRRLWRRHFPGLSRTAAARMIAAAWAVWSGSRETSDMPDGLAACFSRLDRAGYRPIADRQITDDLDDELHPGDCIFLHDPRRDGPEGA